MVNRGGVVTVEGLVCAQSQEPSLLDRLASNRGQQRDGGGGGQGPEMVCVCGRVSPVTPTPAGQTDALRLGSISLTPHTCPYI